MNAHERRKQQLLRRIENHRLLLHYETQTLRVRYAPARLLSVAGPLLALAGKLPWGLLVKYGLLVVAPTAAATVAWRQHGAKSAAPDDPLR